MATETIHLYFSEFEKQLRFVGFIVLGLLSDSTSMWIYLNKFVLYQKLSRGSPINLS